MHAYHTRCRRRRAASREGPRRSCSSRCRATTRCGGSRTSRWLGRSCNGHPRPGWTKGCGSRSTIFGQAPKLTRAHADQRTPGVPVVPRPAHGAEFVVEMVEAAHIDAPALAPRQVATGARWPNPCCCGTSGSCIGAGGAATADPARGSAWRLNLSADDNVRSKNSLSGGIIAPRRLR